MLQTTLSSWLKAPPVPNQSKLSEKQGDREHSLEAPGLRASATGSHETSERHSWSPLDKTWPTSGIPALPANASINPCTEANIKSLKRLISLLLPIPYPDSFYEETLINTVIASLTLIVLWRQAVFLSTASPITNPKQSSPSQLVAGIRCRLMNSPPNDLAENVPVLYISTIGTLSPFRGLALASHLLHQVTVTAIREYGIRAVMAHVWEENEEALAWYKRRGFRIVDKDETYYRRLAPRTAAWLVRRDVRPFDLLSHEAHSNYTPSG